MILIHALCFLSLVSCSRFDQSNYTLDSINDYYSEHVLTVRERLKKEVKQTEQKESFTLKEMPFLNFISLISDKFGQSIVYESSLDNLKISGEYKNASLDNILSTISRRYQKELVKVDGVYFIGTLDLRDNSVLVTRIKGHSIEDVRGLFLSLQAENKEGFFVSSRGIIVLRDKQHIINSYLKVIDFLKSNTLDSFFCELYVFRMSNSFFKQLKFDSKFSALYSLTDSADNYTILLNSLIQISYDLDGLNLTVKPSFLLQDSQPAEYNDTTSIFVETKTSSEGVTETKGFQEIISGRRIKLVLREGEKENTLKINYEDSIIKDINEDTGLPTIDRITFSSTSTLQGSGTYLLSQISSNVNSDIDHLIGNTAQQKSTVTQIFARIYKVAKRDDDQKKK